MDAFLEFNSAWPLIRGFGIRLIIFFYLVSGCATTDDYYSGLDSKSLYYRVRKDDTLYGISQRVGRDYRLIAKWNGISAPFRISEGWTIRLFPPPEAPGKQAIKENTAITIDPAASDPIKKKLTPVEKKSSLAEKKSEKNLKFLWRWPLKGVIAKNYAQTGGKGLDISGKYGEAVRAAADGRIVYCGQGLIGHGNLIIVKHDTHYLSAYGNNSRLFVREGEYVKMGQRIAEVGMGMDKKPVLHFEIRKDGKPVNPIRHLPKP
ncbi:MAG: peptidoglycan DD-metalloendopeptidase family protein [Methylococcales bacterium]